MGIKGDEIPLKRGADYLEVGELFDDDGNIDISGDVLQSDIKIDIDDPDSEIVASFTMTIFEDLDDIDPKTSNPKWKFSRTLPRATIETMFQDGFTEGVADLFRIYPDDIREDIFDPEKVTLNKRVTPEVAP